MTLALLIALLVTQAAWMLDRRWLTNRIIARHAPDLAAIERRPRRHLKAVPEPSAQPTKLSEMAD